MKILRISLIACCLSACARTPDLEISLKREGEHFSFQVANQTSATLTYSPQLIWSPKRAHGDFDLLIIDSKGVPKARCGIVDAPAESREVHLEPGGTTILREGVVVVWAAYCLKPHETYRAQIVYREFPENIPGAIEHESNTVSIVRQE